MDIVWRLTDWWFDPNDVHVLMFWLIKNIWRFYIQQINDTTNSIQIILPGTNSTEQNNDYVLFWRFALYDDIFSWKCHSITSHAAHIWLYMTTWREITVRLYTQNWSKQHTLLLIPRNCSIVNNTLGRNTESKIQYTLYRYIILSYQHIPLHHLCIPGVDESLLTWLPWQNIHHNGFGPLALLMHITWP